MHFTFHWVIYICQLPLLVWRHHFYHNKYNSIHFNPPLTLMCYKPLHVYMPLTNILTPAFFVMNECITNLNVLACNECFSYNFVSSTTADSEVTTYPSNVTNIEGVCMYVRVHVRERARVCSSQKA